MIPTILGAGIVVFFLMRVVPGDICLVRWVDYGTDLNPALLDLCRDQLGLNKSLRVQFLYFMKDLFTLVSVLERLTPLQNKVLSESFKEQELVVQSQVLSNVRLHRKLP